MGYLTKEIKSKIVTGRNSIPVKKLVKPAKKKTKKPKSKNLTYQNRMLTSESAED